MEENWRKTEGCGETDGAAVHLVYVDIMYEFKRIYACLCACK